MQYLHHDGIYSVDPRNYKDAKKIPEIDYEEILELSSLGAQVMHSRSIETENLQILSSIVISSSNTYLLKTSLHSNKSSRGIVNDKFKQMSLELLVI